MGAKIIPTNKGKEMTIMKVEGKKEKCNCLCHMGAKIVSTKKRKKMITMRVGKREKR
jgi:hypothetical protein